LGFAAFFSTPGEVFPGLDRNGLLRPPSIVPPSVPSRSAEVFTQLLHLLRGYPLKIRDEEHRAELLRDCRYFHLRGLEQRLIPCERSFSLTRRRWEIVVRLEDVKVSGLSFTPDKDQYVTYGRPFIEQTYSELILEIGGESTQLEFDERRAVFEGPTEFKVLQMLQALVAKGIGLRKTLPRQLIFQIDESTDVTLDGKTVDDIEDFIQSTDRSETGPRSKKRKLQAEDEDRDFRQWKVRSGQWRLSVPTESLEGERQIVLVAVKIDAYTVERARNANRKFLG
jgi:hypothetical protein